ncbi:hypothetical protein CHS0354_018621 [Potamilus streckersoni]|uniref:Uncharacterized protein n=1 Tax=Potamilus streckersoni TaxID=2493646 RepID=A0AAE0SKC2_9BIVA|nr:hypothetical protein CHS0354_018621 [Potamilus streckersoni]
MNCQRLEMTELQDDHKMAEQNNQLNGSLDQSIDKAYVKQSELEPNENRKLPSNDSETGNQSKAKANADHEESNQETLNKTKNNVKSVKADEDDLGIYDDTADVDSLLSDSEVGDDPEVDGVIDSTNVVELEEAKKKEEEEKKEDKGKQEVLNEAQEKRQVLESANRPGTETLDDQSTVPTFSAPKPPRVQISDVRKISSLRAVNTPASFITEYSTSTRNASRLAAETKEAMFHQAMTLLTARCRSIGQGLDSPLKESSFGVQVPQYFYINQNKPIPMEPLKAWQGYHGNVYFEPIKINPVSKTDDTKSLPDTRQGSLLMANDRQRRAQMIAGRKKGISSEKMERPATDNCSVSSQMTKMSVSSRPSTRQMVLLDKSTILSKFDDNSHEDLVWLEGQESTGSLCIRPKLERNGKKMKQQTSLNKEKICRGSVAHKLLVENKGRRHPVLAVSGGKFMPPASLSPLLRAQTQYSNSSHRLTTNSPDLYHFDSKLPHLEHIRASLKHMDSAVGQPHQKNRSYKRPMTMTDELKPFIKYSPDVVAKFGQHAN